MRHESTWIANASALPKDHGTSAWSVVKPIFGEQVALFTRNNGYHLTLSSLLPCLLQGHWKGTSWGPVPRLQWLSFHWSRRCWKADGHHVHIQAGRRGRPLWDGGGVGQVSKTLWQGSRVGKSHFKVFGTVSPLLFFVVLSKEWVRVCAGGMSMGVGMRHSSWDFMLWHPLCVFFGEKHSWAHMAPNTVSGIYRHWPVLLVKIYSLLSSLMRGTWISPAFDISPCLGPHSCQLCSILMGERGGFPCQPGSWFPEKPPQTRPTRHHSGFFFFFFVFFFFAEPETLFGEFAAGWAPWCHQKGM